MKLIQAWAGVVGIVLALLTWVAGQWKLSETVKDLAQQTLDNAAWIDSTQRQAEIDAAVAAVLAERPKGNSREPSQTEIIGKLAEAAPPPDTAKTRQLDLRQARIKRMAGQLPASLRRK